MSQEVTLESARIEGFSKKGGSLGRRDKVISLVEKGEIEEAVVQTGIRYGSLIFHMLEMEYPYRQIERQLQLEGFQISWQSVRTKALRLRAFGIPIEPSDHSGESRDIQFALMSDLHLRTLS